MQKLEDISVKMLENWMVDVPDTAVLGTSAYADLMKEFQAKGAMLGYGHNTMQVYTSAAMLKVIVSHKVTPDHVSIGTIGIETFGLLKTLGKLDIHYQDPFTFGFNGYGGSTATSSSIFVGQSLPNP